MIVDFPHGKTVTIVRGLGTDVYGDPIPGEPLRVQVRGCAIAPRSSTESVDRGRQGVVIGWTVYVPAGTDITASDRLEIDGDVFEVDGEPGVWVSPFTGWAPGVEVPIRRGQG